MKYGNVGPTLRKEKTNSIPITRKLFLISKLFLGGIFVIVLSDPAISLDKLLTVCL